MTELEKEIRINQTHMYDNCAKGYDLIAKVKKFIADPSGILISDHAMKRIRERFGDLKWCMVELDTEQDFIEKLIENSEYVCETVDNSGKRAHMFIVPIMGKKTGAAICVNNDLNKVITIIKLENVGKPYLKSIRGESLDILRDAIDSKLEKELDFRLKGKPNQVFMIHREIRNLTQCMLQLY